MVQVGEEARCLSAADIRFGEKSYVDYGRFGECFNSPVARANRLGPRVLREQMTDHLFQNARTFGDCVLADLGSSVCIGVIVSS